MQKWEYKVVSNFTEMKTASTCLAIKGGNWLL